MADPFTQIAIQIALAGASYLATALLTPDRVVQGPRRDDLTVTATQPGVPMPRPYGKGPCPGHPIYQTPLIETTTETKESSKGGPSTTTRAYTYSIHLAVAFSAKELVSVSRIRGNQKPVYVSSQQQALSAAEITAIGQAAYDEWYPIYLAEYQAKETAYGDTYTTAEEIALAEAAAEAERTKAEAEASAGSDDLQARYSELEIHLGTEAQTPSPILEALEGIGNVPAFKGTAYFVMRDFQLADFGGAPPDWLVDVNEGAITIQPGQITVLGSTGDAAAAAVVPNGGSLTITYPELQENDVVYLFLASRLSIGSNYTLSTSGWNSLVGQMPGGWTWQIQTYKRMGATPDTGLQIDNTSGLNFLVGYLILRGCATTGIPHYTSYPAQGTTTNGATGDPDPGAATPLDRNDLHILLGNHDDNTLSVFDLADWDRRMSGDSVGGASSQTAFIYTREPTADLDAIDPGEITLGGNDGWGVHHIIARPAEAFSESVENATSIGAILRGELTDWGLDDSPLIEGDHFEIDPALDDMYEIGAVFTRLASPREIFDLCAQIRPITMFESGGIIKFAPRDGDPLWTIDAGDYRAREPGQESPASVATTRIDDAQMPREVRFNYVNYNRGFSGDSSFARLTRSRANQVQTFDVPFVGVPARFKRAAFIAMTEAYASRRTRKQTLPFKYFPIEGGDKGWTPDNQGNLLLSRVKQIELGANFVIDLAVVDHVDSDDDLDILAEGSIATEPGVKLLTATAFAVFDIPRLSNDPLEEAFAVYATMGGLDADWAGGVAYHDINSGEVDELGNPIFAPGDTNYQEVGVILQRGQIGTITILPLAGANEYEIDTNSLPVITLITHGSSFETLTDSAFETSLDNYFLLGDEIIQAKVVNKLDDQTYELSHMRRGARGTEWAIGLQAVGDRAIWLSEGAMIRIDLREDLIGAAIDFKGVTVGADIVGVAATTITFAGEAAIPFAPDVYGVVRNGSGDISGDLLPRAFFQDPDSTIEGLDEVLATDAFEIDILSTASPPTVLRTLENGSGITVTAGSAVFSYTGAQQTTDFGSTQAAVAAVLYELDANSARGKGREVTL